MPLITGKTLPEFHTVLIAFVVFFAAYFAEIVRSGIQSVGSSQVKAALSTGLTYSQSIALDCIAASPSKHAAGTCYRMCDRISGHYYRLRDRNAGISAQHIVSC